MGPLTTGRSKKKLPEVAWQPTRGYVASTTMSGLPLSPSVRSLSTQAATCDGVSDEEELSHYSSPPPPLASHRHVDSPTSVVTSLSSSTVNRHSSVRNESLAPPTAVSAASVVEAWAANLGRGNDDAWLNGPRSEDWYTGVPPTQLCPGIDNNKNIDDAPASTKIRSLPLPHLGRVTRNAVQQYFDNSWTLYETLFAGLKGEEGFYRPPVHGLRHPQIFYYGHTACLYVNKLRVSGVLTKPVNAYFESIFEVGVDEMLWDDMYKNDMVRAPSNLWRETANGLLERFVSYFLSFLPSASLVLSDLAERGRGARIPPASLRGGVQRHSTPPQPRRWEWARGR